MIKRKVGLYLGTASMGIAVEEAKKLLYLGDLEVSSVDAKDSEVLDDNLYWQALIRKGLRQANVESKEVYLSLADRDFIIRSLEMPLMSRDEVESALVYEVEKYIPFKPEELVWDYQYERISKERKIRVSFVGIRKSSLAKTKRILHNADLKATAIEPACLSLSRLLKSNKKSAKVKDFALLDLTSQEVYLTFFQNDLPVFSRYLNIKEKEGEIDRESFIEAVNFSFQYFRREFKEGKLDKIFIFAPSLTDDLVASLEDSLSLEAEKFDFENLIPGKKASVESLKALGCIAREKYSYKFNPTLKELEEVKSAEVSQAYKVNWQWGLIGGVLALALAIYFTLSFIFDNYLARVEREVREKEGAFSLPAELDGVGWQNIGIAIDSTRTRLKELEKFKEEITELSGFFEVFRKKGSLPDGMWFNSIRVNKTRDHKYQAEINGFIYQGDSYQERMGVSDFVYSLGRQEKVNLLFDSVESPSVSSGRVDGFEVTQFILNLR